MSDKKELLSWKDQEVDPEKFFQITADVTGEQLTGKEVITILTDHWFNLSTPSKFLMVYHVAYSLHTETQDHEYMIKHKEKIEPVLLIEYQTGPAEPAEYKACLAKILTAFGTIKE